MNYDIDPEYLKKCRRRRLKTRVKIYCTYIAIAVTLITPNVLGFEHRDNAVLFVYFFMCTFVFPALVTYTLFYKHCLVLSDIYPNQHIDGFIDMLKVVLKLSTIIMLPWIFTTINNRIQMYTTLLLVYESLAFIYLIKAEYKKVQILSWKEVANELKIDKSSNQWNEIDKIIHDIDKQL